MVTEKYLLHYAEPEVLAFTDFPQDRCFQHVLVIPACNEPPHFIDRLLNTVKDSVLVIVVINQSDPVDVTTTTTNCQLLNHFHRSTQQQWQSTDGQSTLLCHTHIGFLVIDRFTSGRTIPIKQAVGLARKIGSDIATNLIANNVIVNQWIHCSDADALLPDNYFSIDFEQYGDNHSVLIYPFQHFIPRNAQPNQREFAALLYEISLRYYVFGLQYAHSDYAYYTIGSTLAVHHRHYAGVRGFPKRAAGEDFYLLNKLSKVGKVTQLSTPVLTLESRFSNRVPFGTGPALQQIVQLNNALADYLYYNPFIFQLLQHWLGFTHQLYIHGKSLTDCNLEQALHHYLKRQQDTTSAKRTATQLTDCLQFLNIHEGLDHAFKQSRSDQQFLSHLSTWFDAFKTLKFIHFMRDNYYPSVTIDKVWQFVFNDDRKTLQEGVSFPQLLSFNDKLYQLTINKQCLNVDS